MIFLALGVAAAAASPLKGLNLVKTKFVNGKTFADDSASNLVDVAHVDLRVRKCTVRDFNAVGGLLLAAAQRCLWREASSKLSRLSPFWN